MTTKTLAEIKRLNESGVNDNEIAKIIGCAVSTIRRWRINLGLPCVGKWTKLRQYTVYNKKTGEYICEGTAEHCAAMIGMALNSFYRLRCKGFEGNKYEIYEVEE